MYNDINFNYIMLSTNHELVSHLTTEYSSFVEKKAGSHCWLLRKVEAGLHQLKLLEWRCSRTAWNLKKCTTVTNNNMLWTGLNKVVSLPIKTLSEGSPVISIVFHFKKANSNTK